MKNSGAVLLLVDHIHTTNQFSIAKIMHNEVSKVYEMFQNKLGFHSTDFCTAILSLMCCLTTIYLAYSVADGDTGKPDYSPHRNWKMQN